MTAREPLLTPVPIKALRPTQITVGLREVEQKRKEWRRRAADKGARFLGDHMAVVKHRQKQEARREAEARRRGD
jgi:hypothetical protein